MLNLSRRIGETIHVSGPCVIHVRHVRPGRVSIGVDAPLDVTILRGELALANTVDARLETAAARGDATHRKANP